ncbi:MAG: RraA family protein [Pseudomonadota bacterium]
MAIDLESLPAALTTSLLSDALDAHGHMGQAMRPFVRPLADDVRIKGRARTGLYAPVHHVPAGDNPYAIEMALIDDLRPGEVAILACDGPTDRIGPWGELLSTAARARGAVGCITDGLVRDVRQIREMRFPVFAGGIGPVDSKGRGQMMAMDVPVRCAGVLVHPGDIVVADVDGVVAVPQFVEDAVFATALAKLTAEDRTREELAAGAKLADVFAKYGVL